MNYIRKIFENLVEDTAYVIKGVLTLTLHGVNLGLRLVVYLLVAEVIAAVAGLALFCVVTLI